ncbi:THAP domain [Popillia japonica]|uniref:THAP domain n=1 Tax=Popillia japonica TaxID=7064 RepID=A0AAW1MMR7_POPJA
MILLLAIVVSRCVVHRIFLAYYKTYKEGNKDIHLFQLPEDEVIRNKWIAQIGGQEVLRRATRVCDIHFDVCYFKSMYRNRIEKDAIPTLFLAGPVFLLVPTLSLLVSRNATKTPLRKVQVKALRSKVPTRSETTA